MFEGIVPASLRLCYLLPQKTHCWIASGPLQGLLFNPSHFSESELGADSLASLSCYLPCALSDGDAAAVVNGLVNQDGEGSLLRAGRRISSA